MPIVDYHFYSSVYLGEPVSETEFPRFLARAESIIDQLTRFRLSQTDLTALPAVAQRLVKEAICAQVEYFAQNGIEAAQTGRDAETWTVGKVHVGGSGAGTALGRSTVASPAAVGLLEQTGLMSRCVGVV